VRGLCRLLLFTLLGAACLAMIVGATSRLILMRRPLAVAPAEPDGLDTSNASWPDLGDQLRAGGRIHFQPPPLPWSAGSPGRHAVPQDQLGAEGGSVPGRSAAGPGE
jgi:hypothetical protein